MVTADRARPNDGQVGSAVSALSSLRPRLRAWTSSPGRTIGRIQTKAAVGDCVVLDYACNKFRNAGWSAVSFRADRATACSTVAAVALTSLPHRSTPFPPRCSQTTRLDTLSTTSFLATHARILCSPPLRITLECCAATSATRTDSSFHFSAPSQSAMSANSDITPAAGSTRFFAPVPSDACSERTLISTPSYSPASFVSPPSRTPLAPLLSVLASPAPPHCQLFHSRCGRDGFLVVAASSVTALRGRVDIDRSVAHAQAAYEHCLLLVLSSYTSQLPHALTAARASNTTGCAANG